jgi:nucleotidyltransferase substrate binding protein (TIGR01987 family)
MSLDLSSLHRAIISLQNAIEVSTDKNLYDKLNSKQKNTMRAGLIQNFEFTYELSWKMIKRWLENNVSSDYGQVSNKELFRRAGQYNLINNVEKWFVYHEARNKTSHIYDEEVADAICKIAIEFGNDAQRLIQNLEKQND